MITWAVRISGLIRNRWFLVSGIISVGMELASKEKLSYKYNTLVVGAAPSSQGASFALSRMALAWSAIPTLLKVLVLEVWRAAPSAAQLPPTCREAAVHASFTCASGAPPRYFFPGLGPCSLCWGWMCAGLLLGASCIAVAWMRVSTRPSLAPAWTVAARELLNCVAEGSEAELTALAEAAG